MVKKADVDILKQDCAIPNGFLFKLVIRIYDVLILTEEQA